MFEYKMVQISRGVAVVGAARADGAAAAYLEDIVGKHAVNGWEFFRMDEFHTEISPGCLGILFFMRSRTISEYVITFRRLMPNVELA